MKELADKTFYEQRFLSSVKSRKFLYRNFENLHIKIY